MNRAPRAAEILETERLMLRRYRAADAAAISEAIEQSRDALEKWTPEIATRRSPAEVAVGLAGLDRAWEQGQKVVYGLYERPTNVLVGEVGLYTIAWDSHVAEIGLWLRTGAGSRGYGAQGFAALAEHALGDLGLTVLEAYIHPANARSRRLAERTGFCLVGSPPRLQQRGSTCRDRLVYQRIGEEHRRQRVGSKKTADSPLMDQEVSSGGLTLANIASSSRS